jgi:hypothetical protein
MASESVSLALFGYLLFGGSLISEPSLLAMTDFGNGTDYDRYGFGVFEQKASATEAGRSAATRAFWPFCPARGSRSSS